MVSWNFPLLINKPSHFFWFLQSFYFIWTPESVWSDCSGFRSAVAGCWVRLLINEREQPSVTTPSCGILRRSGSFWFLHPAETLLCLDFFRCLLLVLVEGHFQRYAAKLRDYLKKKVAVQRGYLHQGRSQCQAPLIRSSVCSISFKLGNFRKIWELTHRAIWINNIRKLKKRN